MGKLITIIAWIILIVLSPWLLVIGLLVCFFKLFDEIFREITKIFDYQIVPYIRWKFHDVRKRFGKKDSK